MYFDEIRTKKEIASSIAIENLKPIVRYVNNNKRQAVIFSHPPFIPSLSCQNEKENE